MFWNFFKVEKNFMLFLKQVQDFFYVAECLISIKILLILLYEFSELIDFDIVSLSTEIQVALHYTRQIFIKLISHKTIWFDNDNILYFQIISLNSRRDYRISNNFTYFQNYSTKQRRYFLINSEKLELFMIFSNKFI